MAETLVTQSQNVKSKPIKLGEFNGAFGKFQYSAFGDLKRAGFAPEVSHKVAMDYGSNIGDAMKNGDDESFRNKIGKAKDTGESSIKISASGLTLTSRAMSVLRAVQVIEGLHKEGLLASRKVSTDSLGEKPLKLQDYVSDCAKWASEQVWEDNE